MDACEEYILTIEEKLPDVCHVRDLVRAGIFNSTTSARSGRISGNSPPYMQMGKRGRVIYPKKGVIEWMRGKINVQSRK